MSFSLITAVYGVDKLHYIERLFQSLLKQNVDLECIIVDQNKTNEVKNLCDLFASKLTIKYLRTDIPGLSRARNKGLQVAEKDIIAFPDDDCEYPEGVLEKVEDFFKTPNYDIFILGLRETNKGYRLEYSSIKGQKEITYKDVFKSCCSVSIFHRNKYDVVFDEDLGLGAKYRSCEDFDYVVSLMRKGAKAFLNDDVFVLHPDNQNLNTDLLFSKIKNNSIGHGVYFRKHWDQLWKSAIYFILIAPIGGVILNSFIFDFTKAKKYFLFLISRLKGFLTFRRVYPL